MAGVDADLAQRFIDEVKRLLVEGESVSLRGLGSFRLATLKARRYETPLMDEAVEVPERDTIKFRPSKAILARLN